MLIAAYEAGVCINNASVTIVHGMSRPIGALFHVPHGISNAMLDIKCLGFAAQGAPGKFAAAARAVGASDSGDDATAARDFLTALGNLCREVEIPTLMEYGIDREKFFSVMDKMADDALASGSRRIPSGRSQSRIYWISTLPCGIDSLCRGINKYCARGTNFTDLT